MKPTCQQKVSFNDNAAVITKRYNAKMSSNRLKYYREKMGLSQDAFGELIGATKGQISKLENEKQPFNERWFRAIEQNLKIERWHLFVDPTDIYPAEHKAIVDAYLALSPAEQSVVDKIFNQDLSGKHTAQTQSSAQSYSLHEPGEDNTNIEDRLTPRELEELRKAMREGRL